MWKRLARIQAKTEEVVTLLCAFAVGIMVLLTISAVVARRALSTQVTGSYEIVMLLFVYVIFFGVAYAQRRDDHITVEFVYQRLPKRAKQFVEGVVLLLCVVITGIITCYSALSTWFNFLEGDILLGSLGMVTWPWRIAVPIGMGLLFLRFLVQFSSLLIRGDLYEQTANRGETGSGTGGHDT